MAQLKFYLNGQPINPPANWKQTEVELSFENNKPAASVRTNLFEFAAENATLINNYISAGLTGGYGVFEGLPYRIEVCDASTIPFDGILNFVDAGNEFTDDLVKLTVKESGRIDFLNDIADSFSFAYLSDNSYTGAGKINTTDYIAVPYVVSTIPNYTESIMISISLFIVVKEIAETAFNIAKLLADITTVFTTPAGILKTIAFLFYLGAMISAAYALIDQLKANILQHKKTKLGMRVKKHFEKACEYLGLTFKSTILDNTPYDKLTIIPRKTNVLNGRQKDEKFGDSKYKGHWDGTFGDFIRAMNDVFNAEIKIIDNVLYFEKYGYWDKRADYTLPNIKQTWVSYGINANEIACNYYIKYALDSSDYNTFDDYTGTSAQMTLEPKVIGERKNLLLKNLEQKYLQFAQARRKTELTFVEKTLGTIIDKFNDIFIGAANTGINVINAGISTAVTVYNAFIAVLNTIPGIDIDEAPDNAGQLDNIQRQSGNFSDRIGWMLLSTDFIDVPKLALIGDDGLIQENSGTYLAASYLLENFHSTRFATRGNQYYIYKDREIPLCCDDFNKIKNNNYIRTFEGEYAKVDSLIWNPHNGTAKITYRIKRDYTLNLQERIIIDGNQ